MAEFSRLVLVLCVIFDRSIAVPQQAAPVNPTTSQTFSPEFKSEQIGTFQSTLDMFYYCDGTGTDLNTWERDQKSSAYFQGTSLLSRQATSSDSTQEETDRKGLTEIKEAGKVIATKIFGNKRPYSVLRVTLENADLTGELTDNFKDKECPRVGQKGKQSEPALQKSVLSFTMPVRFNPRNPQQEGSSHIFTVVYGHPQFLKKTGVYKNLHLEVVTGNLDQQFDPGILGKKHCGIKKEINFSFQLKATWQCQKPPTRIERQETSSQVPVSPQLPDNIAPDVNVPVEEIGSPNGSK